MAVSKNSAELVYTWWERFLNAQSEAFGGDREFSELSNKLHRVRSAIFADREITASETEALLAKVSAVAALYAQLAARKGIPLDASAPATSETFRVFREEAEIHFQTLAGDENGYYRGGLLRQLLNAPDPEAVAHQIVLDLLTSASTPIAVSKVHLMRAQLSLLDDVTSQRKLLELVRHRLAKELIRPVWSARGQGAPIDAGQFDELCRFESVVAVRPAPLPAEIRATNRLLPNHPIDGWDSVNRKAVRALLGDLRSAGKLFLDGLQSSATPVNVAAKLDLNLGIEGAPSVTDPAVTYAVLGELLEFGEARGLALHFTVGDSNGIENAPIGRTTLDIMRETGNYHAALKAALEFASRPHMPEAVRTDACASLEQLISLERKSPPLYFGSSEDRISSQRDREAAEAAASRSVSCIDYDEAGYLSVDVGAGPLGRAVWASNQFHLAEPWVAAACRVHIARAVSTHVFAGWTGALKGLVGLHALGARPADRGMTQRGDSPLDALTALMRGGSFTALFEARAGIPNFAHLASASEDAQCRSAYDQSVSAWSELSRFAAARSRWAEGAAAIEADLRSEQAAGAADTRLMAEMRRRTAGLLAEAERVAPGFRASLMRAVADGTRAFYLTMWKFRDLLPAAMRDQSMGMRIGLLSRLSQRSDLVVQGLSKIGIGGGPDAYFDVRDVGVVLAGADEMSIDLTAIRLGGVPGHPWRFNYPIHGALQFGNGPICWDQIRTLESSWI